MNDRFDAPADPVCAYSLPHYRHLLERAKAKYWLPLVREVARAVPDRDLLLIRHDVDITPWSALRMAELEHSLGVHTTYYYRFHAPFYNLMAEDVIDSVRAVARMGHEVGLHYEPGFFLARDMDPVQGTRNDIRTFEDLVGFRTHSIAQHQPAQGPVLADISDEHPCAYQPALVRGMPYFGDSGFHWREGCVCTKFHHRQVHTLIHPHSWVHDGRPWQDVLRGHARDLGDRISHEMEDYVVHVAEYLARRAELDRERERKYGG
ncbi:MAG: hypothetical protein K8J09_21450 [Planctomycetes bacterium]|nr:hypothetical protein [Planctomycetota bacterium]MCC7395752.1 hypothetical protein [Planctomycetota bacterium]